MSRAASGLRAALRQDQPIVATFLLLPRVEIVEMIARAGFTAVIFDLEHGPFGHEGLAQLTAAARAGQIYAIARVSDNSAVEIGHALDAGVDGVMVPHIGSVDEAEMLAAAARFPPAGTRSVNPYTRGNGYDLGASETAETINSRIALIAMLEGLEALTQLEAICSTPELDGVFIGPVDLSASLGFRGDAEHPTVIRTVSDALSRLRDAGSCGGVYCPTAEAGARWIHAGASLVAVSADVAMALGAFSRMRSELEACVNDARPPARDDVGIVARDPSVSPT